MIINLPTKKGTPNTNPPLDFEQLVIIGANGSGKTRFGSRIEQTYLDKTHRISAQKSLSLPREVSPKSIKRAQTEFKYGYYNEGYNDAQHLLQKIPQRWGGRSDTHLLNDFDKLMVLLHTEEYEEALSFKEGRIPKPVTKLDKVQRIWEAVLPHRKLIKRAGIVEAFPTGQENRKYNASDMSDGERVIFYLIGEAICAPENSILIIDEPEMHIHRSLVKSLFDLVELEREDCSFIYLTHDIDFAFTRKSAKKIWAKSYEGANVWDYEILNDAFPIPEQLYLEVLGSRKPILFIEGDNSSVDYELYQQIYSEFTIKPLGSCGRVIESVKSLNEQKEFHNIHSFGLIDRDTREDVDVENLNSRGIWVLDVAEVENLFLHENIISVVARHMRKREGDILDIIKNNVISFFRKNIEMQIIIHYKKAFSNLLLTLTNFESRKLELINKEVDANYSKCDKDKLLQVIQTKFDKVVADKDYLSVLRLMNMKNLISISKVCELTGIKSKPEYIKLVISLARKDDEIGLAIKATIRSMIIDNLHGLPA